MKIWVDDIRTTPDDTWTWTKTSEDTINILEKRQFAFPLGWPLPEVMSLDHDLGGDDTSRRIVLWMCENDFWPVEVLVHSANPSGIEWLESMINRYHPTNIAKHQMVPPNLNRQYTCVECGDAWPCRIGGQNEIIEESSGSEGGYSRGAETIDEISESMIERYKL